MDPRSFLISVLFLILLTNIYIFAAEQENFTPTPGSVVIKSTDSFLLVTKAWDENNQLHVSFSWYDQFGNRSSAVRQSRVAVISPVTVVIRHNPYYGDQSETHQKETFQNIAELKCAHHSKHRISGVMSFNLPEDLTKKHEVRFDFNVLLKSYMHLKLGNYSCSSHYDERTIPLNPQVLNVSVDDGPLVTGDNIFVNASFNSTDVVPEEIELCFWTPGIYKFSCVKPDSLSYTMRAGESSVNTFTGVLNFYNKVELGTDSFLTVRYRNGIHQVVASRDDNSTWNVLTGNV